MQHVMLRFSQLPEISACNTLCYIPCYMPCYIGVKPVFHSPEAPMSSTKKDRPEKRALPQTVSFIIHCSLYIIQNIFENSAFHFPVMVNHHIRSDCSSVFQPTISHHIRSDCSSVFQPTISHHIRSDCSSVFQPTISHHIRSDCSSAISRSPHTSL